MRQRTCPSIEWGGVGAADLCIRVQRCSRFRRGCRVLIRPGRIRCALYNSLLVRTLSGFGRFCAGRRGAPALLLAAAVVVLGLLVTFAIALANTQSGSKSAIEARVHERAVLAAALVDSLFGTVKQQIPASERKFGAAAVSRTTLTAARGTNAFVALLGRGGQVLGSSPDLTPPSRVALLRSSSAVALVDKGDPYALGNLLPYGRRRVLELALGLSTAYGRRVLVEGLAPAAVSALLVGELRQIPGVRGARNLIVDSADTVIASNVESRPLGYRYQSAAARSALGRSSGDRNGSYYDQVALSDSTWRIVLEAPDGALFASVSGLHRWVPWLIFIALAVVAVVALWLGWRLLRSAEGEVAEANRQLERVNRDLADSNRQLERHAAELARSNAELDQFASIASHDLQEPLRKVRTFTEQVAATESERLSERGADYLARANRAAERMQTLIQDLLQFSRVTSKPRPFEPVDLSEVMAEVLEDLSVQIEASKAVMTVGTLPRIRADRLQMGQLLRNLVSNAIKFRRPDTPAQITVTGEIVGDGARIVVFDNGIGFERQYRERIFRVFERLNGRGEYPGTGIGLALCHKIVARHHGEITADGELGVGATFTVVLPVEQAGEEEPSTEPGADREPVREEAHVSV